MNLSLPAGSRGTLVRSQATVTVLESESSSGSRTERFAEHYRQFLVQQGQRFGDGDGNAGQRSSTDTLVDLNFGGSAVFGTAYLTTAQSLVIPAGQTTGSITLTGNNVGIGSSSESVTVSIGSAFRTTPSGTAVTATLNPGSVASASINGTVSDTSGAALSGIIVYLVNPLVTPSGTFDPAINIFTTTNASGAYSFSGLAAGTTYTVRELVPQNYDVTTPTGDSIAETPTEGQQITGANFKNKPSVLSGAYRATAVDPTNPGAFWTFQAFDDDQATNDFSTWGVQATSLAVTNYTADDSAGGEGLSPGDPSAMLAPTTSC